LAAEEVARRWTLRRAELDDWALRSRDRAARASEGAVPFVHPVATLQGQWSPGAAGGVAEPGSLELPGTDPPRLSKDEARRPEGHDLASLPPVYLPGGVVTAGNMCLEGDGAAAVLVASAARAQALGLAPKARVAALATTGEDPAIWPAATIAATEKVLAVLSLLPAQIGLWYVHESSSAALLAWLKAIRVDPDRVNPDGGALASAAPLGAVGAGLFAEAVSGLTKGGERRVAVCVAGEGGVGTACVLEVA
jgi:acetyl-CoA acetyltransferase